MHHVLTTRASSNDIRCADGGGGSVQVAPLQRAQLEAACWEVRYTAGRVYHLQPVATSSMAAVIRQTITDRDRKLMNRLLSRWGPAP